MRPAAETQVLHHAKAAVQMLQITTSWTMRLTAASGRVRMPVILFAVQLPFSPMPLAGRSAPTAAVAPQNRLPQVVGATTPTPDHCIRFDLHIRPLFDPRWALCSTPFRPPISTLVGHYVRPHFRPSLGPPISTLVKDPHFRYRNVQKSGPRI
jgi:hypothetical protein